MFVIKTQDGQYYNGRASTWPEMLGIKSEAFQYGTKEYAEQVASRFNRYKSIHGFNFEVEKQYE